MICNENKQKCPSTSKRAIDTILSWVEDSKNKIKELIDRTDNLQTIIQSLVPDQSLTTTLQKIVNLFEFPSNGTPKINVGVPALKAGQLLGLDDSLVVLNTGAIRKHCSFNGNPNKVLSGAGTWVDKDDNTFTGTPIEITWEALVELQDSKKLTAGAWYRIIDYATYVFQTGVYSTGNGFDILILATDTNSLCENVYFLPRKNDTYFKNRNLNAWKGKYCLKNDTTRFGCLKTTDSKFIVVNNKYYVKYPNTIGYKPIGTLREWRPISKPIEEVYNCASDSATISDIINYSEGCLYLKDDADVKKGTPFYINTSGTIEEGGTVQGVLDKSKGFIYYLCDEFNNTAGFDFNTIEYKVKFMDENDRDRVGTLFNLNRLNSGNNYLINNNYVQSLIIEGKQYINRIILDASEKCQYNFFIGDYCKDIYIKAVEIRENLFKGECHTIDFEITGDFYNNIIHNNCTQNYTVGIVESMCNNTLGYGFKWNTIGKNFQTRSSKFDNNTFGNSVTYSGLVGSYMNFGGDNSFIIMNKTPTSNYTYINIEQGVKYIKCIRGGLMQNVNILKGVSGTEDKSIEIGSASYVNYYPAQDNKQYTDKYV